MAILELDVNRWAEQQFGACQLGDKRRTRRAVRAAAQFAADPSGSTTRQTESWNDCRGVYRLIDQDDVSQWVCFGFCAKGSVSGEAGDGSEFVVMSTVQP